MLRSRLNSKVVIATTALALAAFGGGAYAATQSGTDSRQAFLNDVAKRLHVTPAQLQSALNGAFDDQLQAAVKAGKLTQAQANELKQRIQQNGGLPLGHGPGPGFFRGGPGVLPGGRGVPPGGRGVPPGPRLRGTLSAAASYLGLTDAQLASQLGSGKSLAQIAKARGKSTSGLEQAILAPIRSRLDKLVAAKRITSAQEQQMLTAISAHLGALINATPGRFVHPPRAVMPNDPIPGPADNYRLPGASDAQPHVVPPMSAPVA